VSSLVCDTIPLDAKTNSFYGRDCACMFPITPQQHAFTNRPLNLAHATLRANNQAIVNRIAATIRLRIHHLQEEDSDDRIHGQCYPNEGQNSLQSATDLISHVSFLCSKRNRRLLNQSLALMSNIRSGLTLLPSVLVVWIEMQSARKFNRHVVRPWPI
jgi:hypothetical protein